MNREKNDPPDPDDELSLDDIEEPEDVTILHEDIVKGIDLDFEHEFRNIVPVLSERLGEKDYETILKDEKIKGLIQERGQRKFYTPALFWVLVGWLAFIVLTVLAHGSPSCPFVLSDSVMIALLTTSTATVVGVFAIVARSLFPKK